VGSLDRQSGEQGVNFLVRDASFDPPCFSLSLPFLAHLLAQGLSGRCPFPSPHPPGRHLLRGRQRHAVHPAGQGKKREWERKG